MTNPHDFYMSIASTVAQASHAVRNKVGAILVKDDNIISFGFNGTPRGFDNVCEIGDVTKPEVLHAESNAITKCAQSTGNAKGSILYVTVSPCFDCAKLIIQVGIKWVIYSEEYRNRSGSDLLAEAKIPLIPISSIQGKYVPIPIHLL